MHDCASGIWTHIPVEDGAFQSLRAGVPDPDTWPAPAFLYALAFAPVGVALAALLPGPRNAAPLLLGSAVAAAGTSLGLEVFASALLRYGTGAGLIVGIVTASAFVALIAAQDGHPGGRAVAGQALVLGALCLVLWIEYTRPI